MKRIIFRILAFPLPTRKLRNIVRRLGGPKIVKPDPFKQIINMVAATQDISKLPVAHGFLRYLQIANLKLLRAFDQFAKNNGIKYFMIGGAIAGKIRHNDCVPWDDDLDIGMLADDYEKLISCLRDTLPNNNFYVLFTSNVCRIIHNGTDAFLDILRYEIYPSPYCYDYNNQEYLTKIFEQFRKQRSDGNFIHFYLTNDMDKQHINKQYDVVKKDFKYTKDLHHTIFDKCNGDHKTVFPMHTDCKPSEFYDYDTIFPIARQKFNKYIFPFPNDLELYAAKCWGNIWTFPTDMFRAHQFSANISPIKLDALRKFNATDDQIVYEQFCKGGI